MKRILILVLISFTLNANEVLNREKMIQLINDENPYINSLKANLRVQNQQFVYSQGSFDTKVGLKYDEKEYPSSDGQYRDLYVEKPLENGIELLAGYRKAYGTQEYSNVKTGDDGEYRVGAKLPIIPLWQGSNENRLNLEVARLDVYQATAALNKHLREFYYTVLGNYYQLLYRHELFMLEKELLKNAQERYRYIEKRVFVGDMAPIVLTESRQLLNEREQRMAESGNSYQNARQHLAMYLNIPEDRLRELELPMLPMLGDYTTNLDRELKKVLENRPELKMLDAEARRLSKERAFAEVMRYPQVDVSVYGVHDRSYNDDGFKISLEMAFPLEQRKYEGKSSELQVKTEKNSYEMKKNLLEAQRTIGVALNTFTTLKHNLANVTDEIVLIEEVEKAEKKRFEIGQSELFMLNQRELRTLQVKQKKCDYHVRALMAMLEIEKETGELDKLINLPLSITPLE